MDTLLTEIEAFIAHHQLSATMFGHLALGDRHLVRSMKGERGRPRRLWPETEAKVRKFMAEYGPSDRRAA
jgi:hypothetical protein